MPYPFMSAFTYGELIERLRRTTTFNVRESGVSYGTKGAVRFQYLERANRPIYILPDVPDDSKRVVPSIVRSTCNTLGLPPEDFGFHLD